MVMVRRTLFGQGNEGRNKGISTGGAWNQNPIDDTDRCVARFPFRLRGRTPLTFPS